MPNANSFLTFALNYAELGYAVFPCIPKGKRPLVKKGLRAASNCPEQIKTWWRRWPSANIALLPPKDILVLDFDDKVIAERWLAQYPELRRAPRTRSPRGGLHAWLKVVSDPDQIKTRVKAAGGEVDLRGLNRAYLIAPPSQTDRGLYHWELNQMKPECLPFASPNLLKAIAPTEEINVDVAPLRPLKKGSAMRRYALAALESEHDFVAKTPEGARNDRLNRAAYALGGYAAHDLLSREEIESALVIAAQRCGLPIREARRTIESGFKAGYQSPRVLPKSSTQYM